MDNDVYKCRLCNRMYHDKEVIIDLSSEEAKNEQITCKILSALSILITDHDPTPQYICRICYGQVEVTFRFATTSRINNVQHMENLTNLPSNEMLRTEYEKFKHLPLHILFNKYQFDVKGLFDAVRNYLSDTNENLNSTQNFDQYIGLNNHNSITNQFNIENNNPVGNGIPEISPVLEVNEPQIDTNNIDNIHTFSINLNNQFCTCIPIVNSNNVNHIAETGINKNVQIDKRFPIGCRNNVTKKKPLPLLKKISDINTINNHSYGVLSKVNRTTNDNEVICVDDDEEDSNKNDNQEVHTQANSSTHKSYQRINKKKPINVISVKKKITSSPDNVQSTNTIHTSNIPYEEVTVTPDVGFTTSNLGSSLNGEKNNFKSGLQINNVSTITSRVLPDNADETTVVSTNQEDNAAETTVDSTNQEDNSLPKKKSSGRKRKNLDTKKSVVPKKRALKNTSIIQYNKTAKIQQPTPAANTQMIKRSNRSLIKPRPKRASAIANSSAIKKMLQLLGKNVEGPICYWKVPIMSMEIALYQCPICNELSTCTKSRQRHEISEHSSLLNSIQTPAVNSAPAANTDASTQQLYLFNYLQLCLVNKDEPDIINQLAKRQHLLKALKILGPKTIGSFKCNYCSYETNLMFVLWAHMSFYHLKCDVEKKASLYCFLCSRPVSKRTTLLKHIEKCSKETSDTINSSNQFTCVHCNDVFNSLIKLEDHTWKHK